MELDIAALTAQAQESIVAVVDTGSAWASVC